MTISSGYYANGHSSNGSLFAYRDLFALMQLVVHPDEGHYQCLALPVWEKRFMMTVCFPDLPLHPVTLHGSLEIALRHADHHLGTGITAQHTIHILVYQTQGIGGERERLFVPPKSLSIVRLLDTRSRFFSP